MSWEKFCATAPSFSIALDGYVNSAPAFNSAGPHVNFDHHSGVNRLATRSTCGQVLLAIRQGLFKTFCNGSEPQAVVYTNDCDEDICLAWTLINNPELAIDMSNDRLNDLVVMEDLLDSTAGCYPVPLDNDLMRQMGWIFQPYREARSSGELYRQRTSEFFRRIILEVERRILAYLRGRTDSVELDGRYRILGGGLGWRMIDEVGVDGRSAAIADGIDAYVLIRKFGELDAINGSPVWVYVLGRISPYIRFPVLELLQALNDAEGTGTSEDRWGGSDLVGGSPRHSGSTLDPTTVQSVINELLDALPSR